MVGLVGGYFWINFRMEAVNRVQEGGVCGGLSRGVVMHCGDNL